MSDRVDIPVCPHCAVPPRRSFEALDKNRHTSQTAFPWQKCEQCGCWWMSPQPSDEQLVQAYGNSATPSVSDSQHGADTPQRISRIVSLVGTGRLLDVGCGVGGFLRGAREAGFQVEGIDSDPARAEWVRQQHQINVTCANFPHLPPPAETYDVVTLWHSIEHVRDPLVALKWAFAALKPGGVLGLATPNPASLQALWFGEDWYHLDSPRHLTLIPPAAMTSLLARLGFVSCSTYFGSPEHDWAGIALSAQYNRYNRPSWSHRLLRRLARASANPLARLEAVFGRGGTYEVYARREHGTLTTR